MAATPGQDTHTGTGEDTEPQQEPVGIALPAAPAFEIFTARGTYFLAAPLDTTMYTTTFPQPVSEDVHTKKGVGNRLRTRNTTAYVEQYQV